MLCRSGVTSCDEPQEKPPRQRRLGWGHLMFAVFLVVALWAVAILASIPKAHADIPPGHTVTNRDCWAALEDSDLVAPCEALGWQVVAQHHLLLTRRDVVRASDIAPCTFEDGSGGPLPCGWNIGSMHTGNDRGLAYWVSLNHRINYVWGRQPSPVVQGWAHWSTPWERHHLSITKTCWVAHPAPHRWQYQCPADGAPS